jgi:hypothetical protein
LHGSCGACTPFLINKSNNVPDALEVLRDKFIIGNLNRKLTFYEPDEVQDTKRVQDSALKEWIVLLNSSLPGERKVRQNEIFYAITCCIHCTHQFFSP